MANQFIVKNGLLVKDGGASITGSVSLSGNLVVGGDITAQQLIISSSVTHLTQSFSSGSTIFGDTFDDTHTFTGSVNITGSLSLNGSPVGTGKLNSTEFYNWTGSNSSLIASSSYSNYALTASYVENPTIVSGQTKTLTIDSSNKTWSFNHGLGYKYPAINVFDSNGYVIIPKGIRVIDNNNLEVYTDAYASPTGFPIKVALLSGTQSDLKIRSQRTRLCDAGYLRMPFLNQNAEIRYRCPSEPIPTFLKKGGSIEETNKKACLCNALLANIGLAQHRLDNYIEEKFVTLGSDLSGPKSMITKFPSGWSAAEAISEIIA